MATRELFTAFRTELDAFHDRRERLVKISRDITTLSKRVIFLLHRLAQEGRSFDEKGVVGEDKEVNEKLNDINNHWTRISSELDGESYWKFSPCISPGLQEYIEAISFLHYLGTGKLMSYKAVQSSLISRSSGRQFFTLSYSDYLLGISDLSGELMRYAITSAGFHSSRRQNASKVCDFVRDCRSDFEALTPYVKGLSKKQYVTLESLRKIEDATYGIVVRGSEYEGSQEIIDDIVEKYVSGLGFSSSSRPTDRWGGAGRGGGGDFGEDDEYIY